MGRIWIIGSRGKEYCTAFEMVVEGLYGSKFLMDNIRKDDSGTLSGSFFWRQLRNIKHIFNWSCTWTVGDGARVSFWFDAWQVSPLADRLHPGQIMQLPNISLRDAWHLRNGTLPDSQQLRDLQLNNESDWLKWRWEATGVDMAKSIYNVMLAGGKVGWRFKYIWRCKLPPIVKIFMNLVLHGKILTHDVMRTGNMICPMECVVCQNCSCETTLHLLFTCSYATRVWRKMEGLFGRRIMCTASSVQEVWGKSEDLFRVQGGKRKKDLGSMVYLCVLSHLEAKKCGHLWRTASAA